MRRRNLCGLATILCLTLICTGLATAASKPNIIMCMTDDQGWGDTSYYGHPHLKTPELDAMAAAGIRFDRFFTAHPMCSPTRASCLSGRSPSRFRCMTWGHDLPLGEVTIAEAVKTAGYATGHFGKWHVGGIPHATGGTGRGLPESFDPKPRHPGNQGFDEWWSAGNNYDIGYEYIYHNGKQVPPSDGDTSDVLMDVSLEWIGKQAKSKQPFLAVIWFPSPHGPFEAAEKYIEPYKQYGNKRGNYYGELAGVDHAMGTLRKALREMKIADNTMLWFCSDNGGYDDMPLSTGGLPGGKKWLSEGGTRVPAILEWPSRIPKPFITTVPSCTMDFYPTVLDLLGIKMPDQAGPIDGISLMPLIDGKMKSRTKPIPLVDGMQVRIVDNEYRFQKGRLFRFDEEKKKDIDITDQEPELHKTLDEAANKFVESVKQDQAKYVVKSQKKKKVTVTTQDWEMGPFVKRKEPVLRPTPDSRFQCPIRGKEVRWEEQNAYNPAVVVRKGKVYLLYRADDKSPDLKWGRTCRIGLAHSEDGINFTRHPKPVLYPDNDAWKEYEWTGGCEDLHVIEDEDGTYYMNYTTWNGNRDTMSVATSKDLYNWTKHGPAFAKSAPDKVFRSRSGVVVSRLKGDRLVAAKINGKYWMYYTFPCALAWSDNLIDWTPAGKSVWHGGGHEAGAIALLRDDGILLMTQGGSSLGAWTLRQTLVDRNDLLTILKNRNEPFLYPEYEWEQKGFVNSTTVANGMVFFKGKWLLYYGAADRRIGLARFEPK